MINNLEGLIRNVNPNRNNGGKSPIGEPFGPGTQLGFSIGQLRDFVKLQKRAKGYDIQTTANTTTNTQLVISGNAKILLGLNIGSNAGSGALLGHWGTLEVNNEIIFQDINLSFLSPELNWKEEEYFPFPRPLSGSDDVKLSIRSGASADIIFAEIYYI